MKINMGSVEEKPKSEVYDPKPGMVMIGELRVPWLRAASVPKYS